jgi:hypothetical protein
MELAVISGVLVVLTVYLTRLTFPLLTSITWQLFSPALSRLNTPESNDEFFYTPKPGDHLIFRWYWPDHKIAIPLNFTVGAVLAWLYTEFGLAAYDALKGLMPFMIIMLLGLVMYKLTRDRAGLWSGIERFIFTSFSVAEFYIVIDLMKYIASSI